jgi:hypothetical protein
MSLKKLCPTPLLTFVLATSALAGGMEGGENAPPTAPATAPTQSSGTETSSTSTAATGSETAAAVSVTEAALGLVGAVLALFEATGLSPKPFQAAVSFGSRAAQFWCARRSAGEPRRPARRQHGAGDYPVILWKATDFAIFGVK